jgi:hypothetical protein
MRILAIFLFVLLVSCDAGNKNQNLVQEERLTFRIETFDKEFCVGENCAQLALSWPVASGGEAAKKINQAIQEHMSFLVQTGEENAPLDSMIVAYFSSFDEFKKEFPDSYGGWEIAATAEVSYLSDSTLSIYFTQQSFLGGAHPNSLVSFLNFDPSSGEILSLDRLISNEKALLDLAEKKFRAFHEVQDGVSLEETGSFFLPEAGFFLANAKGFKDDKFWVIYIPYEIGPYVMGYTELEFSREEIPTQLRW